jgi:hypothetical protein
MGVGAYVQVGARNYLNFLSETYLNTPIFIIIAGEDRPHILKGTVLRYFPFLISSIANLKGTGKNNCALGAFMILKKCYILWKISQHNLMTLSL